MSEIHSPDLPMCIITLGMAGAGKTTFVMALKTYIDSIGLKPYVVNIDPAVAYLPYDPDIDIRTSVNYDRIKSENNLGPNGAIIASLGFFCTKIDQLVNLLTKRSQADDRPDYFIIDTPGQIEVFTWSASGSIITQAVSARFPTMIAYVMDTVECSNPNTFMQNMLYSCGMLYQYNLPFLCVFNKIDIIDWKFIREWMTDFEVFDEAICENHRNDDEQDAGAYLTGFTQSLVLVLDKFYENISACGVSALNVEGFPEFVTKAEQCRQEYYEARKLQLQQKPNDVNIEAPLPGDETLAYDLTHNCVMDEVVIDGTAPMSTVQDLSKLHLDDIAEDKE